LFQAASDDFKQVHAMSVAHTDFSLVAKLSSTDQVESRVERNGKVGFYSITREEQTGHLFERIYDENHHLEKIVKRGPGFKFEAYLDPSTGEKKRTHEVVNAPDGNTITTDVAFLPNKQTSQVISVARPTGRVLSVVERQQCGAVTTYQSQTDYAPDGNPSHSVNHHIDYETGLLMHTEQVHWLQEAMRAMTEHFFFDFNGNVVRYTKILHYTSGGAFSEETQIFDSVSRRITRRELIAFSQDGQPTCVDVLHYDSNGAMHKRDSQFFDESGQAIAARHVQEGNLLN
jgi:hypothetical protein